MRMNETRAAGWTHSAAVRRVGLPAACTPSQVALQQSPSGTKRRACVPQILDVTSSVTALQYVPELSRDPAQKGDLWKAGGGPF